MEKSFHPYHMVMVSPWPLMSGMGVLLFMLGMVKMFMEVNYDLLVVGFFVTVMVVILWWRDVIRESTYLGLHSSNVMSGLMLGMILFIISEVFFFISFFWAFFHLSLSPNMEMGMEWPPVGIFTLNPFQVPLLNTVILLTSGATITLCHQSILNENWVMVKNSILMTWMLGVYFLMLQLFEYSETSFSMSDSVFGSVFFMATGFHGFHVMVGSIFLVVMWLRMLKSHFSMGHHFGFEASAWYWHFVDVVWLFLFSVVYWWGS